MTTLPNSLDTYPKSSIPLLGSFQRWLTPYSTDRDEAFRERNLRGAILIISIVTLSLALRQLFQTDIVRFISIYGIQYAFLLSAAGAIVKRRLKLGTGIMVAYLCVTVPSVFLNGYWSPVSITVLYIVILVWALILPWSKLLLGLVGYSVVVYTIMALLENTPSPLGDSDSFGAPISAIFTFYGITLVIVSMGYYLFHELMKQRRELQDLVNTLEARVAARTHDLETAHQQVEKLYQEQVKLVEELRTLDNMKSQFLASMSHELRTPLNAILNFTEFMLLGMLGPINEKQHDALDKALGSGKHLLTLINDVLDMTKIQAGMMKLFVEDNIDLHKEIGTVTAATESLLKDKIVRFVQDIDKDLPLIVGDKRRIRQILLNLLSNAVKFTESGSITLSVKKRSENILFMVSDTGNGIAKEDHDIIFEPFRQTDTGMQHAGGTGLGLPISRKLAEAHGGRLWVESESGEGTTFYVELPTKSPDLLMQIPEKAVSHV